MRLCRNATIGDGGRVGYAGAMKCTVLVIVLVGCTVCAAATPQIAFHDLPSAVPIGSPGIVSARASLSTTGWNVAVTGSLTSRVDVAFRVDAETPFDPELRLLLVRDLLPVNVAVIAGLDRITLATTLRLGPVHLAYGRSWGEIERRWAYTQYAFDQRVTSLLGLEESGGALEPILGLRLHPGEERTWGLSLIFDGESIRLSIGGLL